MDRIYVEGGGSSKADVIRCRDGFRRLFEKAGFQGRMPRFVPCGPRNAAFDDFKTAHRTQTAGEYIAMLIDSEEPLTDAEKTWEHLKRRDCWDRPGNTSEEQVLFMTTSMETWIVADRETLKSHYGSKLQESALPPLHDLENRDRHDVQKKLVFATRDCSNAYKKGRRSFEILEKLDPKSLEDYLPSFRRITCILRKKLR